VNASEDQPSPTSNDAQTSDGIATSQTLRANLLVLSTAFLGWFFAGMQLAISSLVMRPAAKDLLGPSEEALLGFWFGRLITAFLLGAAAGGLIFGRLGDRIGRSKAMAASILCYSIFSGATYFVQEPWQLLVLRFLTCMGLGGMWPNGIALVSEAWSNISRPFLAGVIGTAANVGIMVLSALLCFVHVTPDAWRWVMLVGAAPALLGIFVLFFVPESARWLKAQQLGAAKADHKPLKAEVFRPPLLRVTLLGIALGTVPLFGGWGSSNWANAWASKVGDNTKQEARDTDSKSDPGLKARLSLARSLPGSISSLLGGALALMIGRRLCYFLLSLGALFSAQYLFWFLEPGDAQFYLWTGILGFFSGFFFGWLPLCLPELFPTRVRSTGAGVSFNFGRILTAVGVLGGAALLGFFGGDYAKLGRVTSLVYAVGLIVIWFAPIRSDASIED
jgi:SHS family sialic acid transporter-like MFS transporter